jgi:arylsulfatase A-like enzyme
MKKTNILFILIDDLGWRDIGCAGSNFYQTPHIDRLSAEGMRFTDAYASCPVCSPTRASVMTGQYPATVGITDWIDWGGRLHPLRGRVIDVPYLKRLKPTDYSLPRVLKEAGYQTWHVGKWHLGGEGSLPENHGFEVNIGGCHAGSPGAGGYFSPWSIPVLQDVDVPPGTYLTDYLTDCAVKLIQERDADRPFFLNLWPYAVHIPIQAKPDKVAYYKSKARLVGLDRQETFRDGEFFPCEPNRTERIRRRLLQSDPTYAAMIENLDENLGRVLQAIDDAGESENTLVIFTSDNGGLATSEGSPTCNAPLAEGKGWMYEGGVRVPLIVKWPDRIRSGSICRESVTTPDFYPTLLEVAGSATLPGHELDGVSLTPLLTQTGRLGRKAIFWHYPHYGNQGGTPGSSMRMGDYKLIEFFEDGRLELYDLKADPGETRNLAVDQPRRVEEMRDLLAEWRRSVEARIPQPNPDYVP